MTRETRIGLVIALVFIISFGLILSELTGGASPPREDGLSVTVEASGPSFPPIIEVSETPEVGVVATVSPEDERDDRDESPEMDLISLAAQDPGVPSKTETEPQRPPDGERDPPPSPRTYVVRPDDTLWGIARKFYGEGSEGRYKEILSANREILSDESLVHVGQKLVIPGHSPPGREPERPTFEAGEVSLPIVPPSPRGSARREMNLNELKRYFRSSQRIYVVRDGDNLTGIAREQLNDGSGGSVMKIYNANRDKLTSPDVVPVGTRLRIPG
jgi:nucleoid-associated protein YgaU